MYAENYKTDRTLFEVCYKKRNNNISSEKLSVIDEHLKIRTLLVERSFWVETHLMLKILPRVFDRDIYRITKSPFEHCSNSKIKNKESEKKLNL